MLKNIRRKIQALSLKRRTILWLSICGILIVLLFSKSVYQYLNRVREPAPMPVVAQTIRVKEAPMPELIETVGSFTAEREVSIKAGAAGKVQKLLVEAGAWVKAGALLAHIIGAPEVRAPFDGYLTDWQVKEGEQVASGNRLIELVDTDVLSLTYKVPENYAPVLKVGQTLEISTKASSHRQLSGVVRFVSPVVDRKTYTILVRATVTNPDKNLWPGMSAYVRHILKMQPNALVIPEACLLFTMEGHEVLMVVDGQIQKRSITIGVKRNGRVQVIQGLGVGDQVILARTQFIQEGKSVTAQDWLGDW